MGVVVIRPNVWDDYFCPTALRIFKRGMGEQKSKIGLVPPGNDVRFSKGPENGVLNNANDLDFLFRMQVLCDFFKIGNDDGNQGKAVFVPSGVGNFSSQNLHKKR